MMQWLRKIISSTQQTKKKWFLFFIFSLILFYLAHISIFNGRIIEPQSILSVLGTMYANSFNNLDRDYVVSILGTLAQSNATILAIVMSLGLVVIEFSASKYPAKVVDFIEHDPIMWIFLIIYGLSIFYPVYLTMLVNENTNNSNLKFYFITTYMLSIIAYISLSYYIHYVFKMLKSNSIIYILSEKIDKKRLLNSLIEVGAYESKISKDEPRINRILIGIEGEKDPLLPIIQIIQTSSLQHDYNTVEYGLEAIANRLLNILRRNPAEEKRISGYVLNHIFEIWKLALKNKDFKLIKMILALYYEIGEKCTIPIRISDSTYDNSLLKRLQNFLVPLCNTVGISNSEEKILQNNLLYTTFLSEYYIKEAFKLIAEMNEKELQNLSFILTNNIHELGKLTFKNRIELRINKPVVVLESLEGSISEFSYILKDIGIAVINAGSKSTFQNVIYTFNDIGEAAIRHNLIHSISHILENLKIVGEESAKKGVEFESLTKQIVEYLENLAYKIEGHSIEITCETQNQIVEYYEYIKLNYEYERTKDALKELNDEVELIKDDIYYYIYTIGMESIKTNILDTTRQCLKSLEIIERILYDDTKSINIGESIGNLGEEAVKKEQTFPLMEDIIKSLYSIGLWQFGYMFDWDRDRNSWDMGQNKYQKFLKKEYSDYLARGLQISYSEFVNNVNFKDIGDSNCTIYPDDMIYGEKILIIVDEERKDIKCLHLKGINDGYRTTKLFKVNDFKDSGEAYYRIPELLKELAYPIIEHILNSPSDKTLKPFTMIIDCFENFGLTSIHYRDEFSLNKIYIRSLIAIGDSFNDYKYTKYNEDNNAWGYLDLMTKAVSNSIYKLAIESLTYNFVDISILNQQMECLIRIQRKYHNIFWVVAKFERILEMIKEYKLKESEDEKTESERKKIIIIIENAIQEFKSNNANE